MTLLKFTAADLQDPGTRLLEPVSNLEDFRLAFPVHDDLAFGEARRTVHIQSEEAKLLDGRLSMFRKRNNVP